MTIHLIDTLAAGGAERVAVNLFNSQQQQSGNTWLCSTRKQGPLLEALEFPDHYWHLGKTGTFDLRAFFRLVQGIRHRRIQIIHAHAGSVYWGVALKWFTGCKLVWHDHHGNRPKTGWFHTQLLRFLSNWLDATVSVSDPIQQWHRQNLRVAPEAIQLIPHFSTLPMMPPRAPKEMVPMVCVANLRPEKGHLILLAALKILVQEKQVANFQVKLIGHAPDAAYQKTLESALRDAMMEQHVVIWGPDNNIAQQLEESEIGILSSHFEGLPLALLEYGQAGLACVCSDVGDCATVLDHGRAGLLTPPGDAQALADALEQLILHPELRRHFGRQLQQHVAQHYSAAGTLKALDNLYKTLKPDQ